MPSLTINSAGARYTFRFFTALHFAMAYESRPAKNYISLIKIIPQSHAGQIRPDASFEAEFSGPLDASTVNNKFISLTCDKKPVKIRIKYLKNSFKAVIVPVETLRYGKIYNLIFKTGLRGEDGEKFKTAIMYQYSVISDPDRGGIKIISQFPPAGAEIYESRPIIFVQFDRPLVFSPSENLEDLIDYFTLFDINGTIPSKVRYNRILKRLELTPSIELKNRGVYSAAVGRKARGANNKGLFETFVWQFKIFRPIFYLINSYPSKQKNDIKSYDRILLTFSEPLDSKIDYDEFIKILDEKGASINGKFTVYDSKNLIFIPDFAFYPCSYKLKISNRLKSFNANRLNESSVIKFNVAPDDYNIGEKISEK